MSLSVQMLTKIEFPDNDIVMLLLALGCLYISHCVTFGQIIATLTKRPV